jgi:hypothetical protein
MLYSARMSDLSAINTANHAAKKSVVNPTVLSSLRNFPGMLTISSLDADS